VRPAHSPLVGWRRVIDTNRNENAAYSSPSSSDVGPVFADTDGVQVSRTPGEGAAWPLVWPVL